MRVFYLKNWNDTTNNRINGKVKVKQHDRNCSDLGKKELFRIQMCSKNPPLRKCAPLSQKERNKGFLMPNVCLCNIKEDKANI